MFKKWINKDILIILFIMKDGYMFLGVDILEMIIQLSLINVRNTVYLKENG